MINFKKSATRLVALSLFPLAMAACNSEPTVSFTQDVKPLLEQHCVECHLPGGAGTVASGFSMASYDTLMKGTNFGPMIIAGDVEGSNLLVLVEGRADPSINMPHGGRDSVAKQDIETIRLWIKQGARNN